jgi:hypothetical protein
MNIDNQNERTLIKKLKTHRSEHWNTAKNKGNDPSTPASLEALAAWFRKRWLMSTLCHAMAKAFIGIDLMKVTKRRWST